MYSEAIQKLYVAYFNRPADVGGLAYWEQVVAGANGSTAALSAEFARSDEYQAAYAGMNSYQLVAQVYLNLFGHSPDPKGIDFWAQALANKQMTMADMVTQIAGGAQGSDLVAFNSKVAAASVFTAALDTTQEALSYSGDLANRILKNFLATIADEATMKAATTPEALQKVIDSLTHGEWMPLTYMLTPGKDFQIGTLGNDVFTALAFDPVTGKTDSTMSPTDFIDGGAGQDVLNIEIKDGHNAAFGIVRNIETININADTATPVDASLFLGATLIRQRANAGAVTNLADGSTAAFSGSTIAGALSVAAAGATANVAFDGVGDAASLAISGTTLRNVSVSGSRVHAGGGTTTALAMNVSAGTNVQTLSVTTDQKTALTVAEGTGSSTHLVALDASASTGAISFDASATPAISTIKMGSGDDNITAAKIGAVALNVQGGDGNDTVIVTGRLAAGDVIDGGAGTNTLLLLVSGSSAATDPVLNTVIKNFSTVRIFDSSAKGGLDASQLGSAFTSLTLDAGSVIKNVGTQSLVARGDLTATAAGYIAGESYAGNLHITETSSGVITAQADQLTLGVTAATKNVSASVAGDVRAANVNLMNGVDATIPTLDTIANLSLISSNVALPKLASLTLTGNGSASVINNPGSSLTMVDASGLGGKLVATGGATQGLTYTSTSGNAEIIKLGSGIDHIAIGMSTYDSMDTIVGFNATMNSAGTGLAAGSDRLEVSGMTGVRMFTPKQSTLGMALVEAAASAYDNLAFNFGGDTYLYHDAHGNYSLDGDDFVVKLTGVIDLKALILALGGTPG